MTSFLELVQKRRSVRAYDTRPVEREKIERCLEAARLAPSACNAQPWKFTVIQDAADIAQIAKSSLLPGTSMNRFVQDVPIVIRGNRRIAQYHLVSRVVHQTEKAFLLDIGMAAEHFCLQAVEEDLGTCMLGWFNERKVKRIFGIPRETAVFTYCTRISGGFVRRTREKNRKTPDEMRRFESYR